MTYPSRVIAACLLLFAGCLGRAMSTAPSRDGRTALGAPMPMLPDLAPITAEDKGAAAAPPGGDVGDGGEDGGGVDDVLGGSMPPPPSPGPGLSGGGGGSGAGAAGSPAPAPLPQAGAGGAVAGGGGLDPLASLRRQYNAVTREVQRIQNILDTIAGWLERGEALMTWQDPLASSLLLLLLALLAGAFWLLGARTIVAAWLLWTIRPPALRQPLPPPPANFVANLPTRSDRMM